MCSRQRQAISGLEVELRVERVKVCSKSGRETSRQAPLVLRGLPNQANSRLQEETSIRREDSAGMVECSDAGARAVMGHVINANRGIGYQEKTQQ